MDIEDKIRFALEGEKLKNTYRAMQARCAGRKTYLEKNIYVCEEWLNSYDAFLRWSLENGHSLELSLDRTDNYGPYAPWNCKWETKERQARNMTSNQYVDWIDGKRYSFMDLYDKMCPDKTISADVIRSRFFVLKWDYDRIFTDIPIPAVKLDDFIEFRGELVKFREVMNSFATVNYAVVQGRLRKGWNIEEALTTPYVRRIDKPLVKRYDENSPKEAFAI